MKVEEKEPEMDDPFAGLEEEEEIQGEDGPPTREPTLNDLVTQFDHAMTAAEYLSADNDLDTCFSYDATGEW